MPELTTEELKGVLRDYFEPLDLRFEDSSFDYEGIVRTRAYLDPDQIKGLVDEETLKDVKKISICGYIQGKGEGPPWAFHSTSCIARIFLLDRYNGVVASMTPTDKSSMFKELSSFLPLKALRPTADPPQKDSPKTIKELLQRIIRWLDTLPQ